MLKVVQCEFCAKYFKVSETRHIIERNTSKDKSKIVICKTCHTKLSQGNGIERVTELLAMDSYH